MMRGYYSPKTQRAIVEAYQGGVRVHDIVATHGVSTSVLYEILAKHGVRPDRVRHGKPRTRAMVSEYLQRECDLMRIGYVDIAERIGYSHNYTYIVMTGYVPMTPWFAQKLGEGLRLDGDRIYQEAEEWWRTHRGGDE